MEQRQQRYDILTILAYIARYKQRHGQRSPSERRIQADLDISAPSVVHAILQRLERAELLVITRYGRGQSSELTVTEAGYAAVQRWQQEQDTSSPNQPQ